MCQQEIYGKGGMQKKGDLSEESPLAGALVAMPVCGELLFIWKGGYRGEDVLATQHFSCPVAHPGLGSGCQNPSESS